MAAKFKSCSVEGCNGNSHGVGSGLCRKHYVRMRRHGEPLHATPGERTREFINLILDYEGTECKKWPFSLNANGRGQAQNDDGKRVAVHRLICEKAHGKPPSQKHEAAHSCGKGHEGCVTKGHLSWKTHVENIADKAGHGTLPIGEKNGSAKITESQAVEIFSLKGREPQRETARRFGISQANVCSIQTRRSWFHLP